MKESYLETVSLIERLHRHFLEVVKAELDKLGIRDCNNIQALILFNIGNEELTVGELTLRGYYLGSNVSYNLKKMVDNDYLAQERSAHDRRSVRVRLTEKGQALCATMDTLFDRQIAHIESHGGVSAEDLATSNATLLRLERFWTSMMQYGLPDIKETTDNNL